MGVAVDRVLSLSQVRAHTRIVNGKVVRVRDYTTRVHTAARLENPDTQRFHESSVHTSSEGKAYHVVRTGSMHKLPSGADPARRVTVTEHPNVDSALAEHAKDLHRKSKQGQKHIKEIPGRVAKRHGELVKTYLHDNPDKVGKFTDETQYKDHPQKHDPGAKGVDALMNSYAPAPKKAIAKLKVKKKKATKALKKKAAKGGMPEGVNAFFMSASPVELSQVRAHVRIQNGKPVRVDSYTTKVIPKVTVWSWDKMLGSGVAHTHDAHGNLLTTSTGESLLDELLGKGRIASIDVNENPDGSALDKLVSKYRPQRRRH